MNYNLRLRLPRANNNSNETESQLVHRWEVHQAIGQAPAVIRVKNLQTSLEVGKDAWGRLRKQQPVLISTNVFLRAPFESASTKDAVTTSTVHYGTLSKAILKACQEFTKSNASRPNEVPVEEASSLASLTNAILFFLTHSVDPKLSQFALNKESQDPILKSDVMTALEITVLLPKASLLGAGISFTQSLYYDQQRDRPGAISLVLGVHGLRIPTLIGVNSNERLAKQIVIANVEIDPWHNLPDEYNKLEQVVIKTMEESSFQTLEALATHLGDRINECFILPTGAAVINSDGTYLFPDIKICLEKPTAVTFADAPTVELLVHSDPLKNKTTEKFYEVSARDMPEVPFPLQGRLDEWLEQNRVR
ncbi:uncharacterized protein BP5553_06240 [Venustampulla echinocandica]|uniref:dihydroneopterin aldolase n=1 Tax=Venustampulla echinocandica TaxID=2656787 RepID=A0A370TN05_9HELO|nr:uncharacterized protein BP5553_06240 [Venustampulla echinocandica]RDL36888.1 hypothetical protein BP5553_06240 [Venustampulla echinocandica]